MDLLDLADWRERVARLYLSDLDLTGFRAARDELFRTHPQSPTLPSGTGPQYFPGEDSFAVDAPLEPATGTLSIDTGSTDGIVTYSRVAVAHTPFGPLTLWWLDAYGGGLFLPFRDATARHETYGGGRYLTDTIKGTFGRGVTILDSARVRLDFNYAYNPSCAYSDEWVCPLAPSENWLEAPIRAGELKYRD
jgi:uncharacterized protein (DUF1684 family)